MLTSCCKCGKGILHQQTALPPSFNIRRNGLKASAAYRLRAKVERSGLLRRNVTVNHILTFRPLSPPRAAENEPPMFVTSASSLAGSALGLTDAIPGSLSPSSLPPYTPSIFLEASMMSPLVVRPGDRVRLNLKLAIPQELLESVGELWLTSLSIRFSTTCTARVGLISKQKQTYTAICSTAGNLPIDTKHGNGRLMLPPALWESYRYPMALASFRTCTVENTHEIEVTVGLRTRTCQTDCVRVPRSLLVSGH